MRFLCFPRLRLLAAFGVLLAVPPLRAQTVVNLVDGQTDSNTYSDYWLTFNIDAGTATLTQTISSPAIVGKTGAGTLNAGRIVSDNIGVSGGTLVANTVGSGTGTVGITGAQSALIAQSLYTGQTTLGYDSGLQGGSLTIKRYGGFETGSLDFGYSASMTVNQSAAVQIFADARFHGDNNRVTLDPLAILEVNNMEFFGSGNSMTINANSSVQSVYLHLGMGGLADALDNQIVVTGTNANWRAFTDFVVGWTTADTQGNLYRGGGTVTVQNGGSVQADGGLTLARGPGSTGTLNIGSQDLTTPTTGGTITAPSVVFDGGEAAINFNQTNAASFSTAIIGHGSVTQRGNGTTTLAGENSLFSGTTAISNGTLVAGSNTAFGTSAVTVTGGTLNVGGYTLGNTITLDGGTLAGTGTLMSAVSFGDGAHLAPGNSPGTLMFTSGLALNNGTVLDFQLGTTSDQIVVSGGTLAGSASAGGITLNLSDAGGFGANTYVLFDFAGAALGSFDVSDFTLGSTIAGYDYSLALNGSTLELTAVSASAVPEPSTYATLLGIVCLAMGLRRRKKA